MINTSLKRAHFADQLKLAEVVPVFKEKGELNKAS